jgi:hypothetical protein
MSDQNIFDNLPALSAPKRKELRDELEQYLSSDPTHVVDVLEWWTKRQSMYPSLSRMALDYLSIPGKPCLDYLNHQLQLICSQM